MDKLIETFCDVDDFCQLFIEQWQQQLIEIGELMRPRACKLSPSEVMTILIHFHQSHYRDFKSYYLPYVCRNLTKYFPNLLTNAIEQHELSGESHRFNLNTAVLKSMRLFLFTPSTAQL
ncbi:hypothetical protein BOO92_19975 [Vibrio navarrensis]|uniref:hypothetical protein n=1 Tax=Vibrio navarrensis TaxID=29495 RepID=UPI001867A64F|nr:hypothetical protein [Vibrio navarrensis]MBE3658950.1 hypothetical protein [Vibrio navarrensis]